MTEQAPEDSRSERLRLIIFRTLAGFLLFLATLGFVSLVIGVYLTSTDPRSDGWFPPLLLSGLALVVVLLIRVSYRALKVKSVEELQEQSRSRWLDLGDASSPNKSLDRTHER
ncbi:MAG TPA: hypothetical protein VJM31_04715 [Vicinamibacterales bacterium]|nr:hypothetical protein [Vicinamibacterales bacterium]